MALQKVVVEVPFGKGPDQKPSEEVREMDVPYLLRNVEMRKSSSFVKRNGRAAFSTSVVGPDPPLGFSLPTFENIARLAERSGELVALCENSGTWGSAGGAGNAGDTVFSYSGAESGWKPFGKVGRPTSEVLDTSPPADSTLQAIDGYVGNGRLISVQSRDTGIHATVIDLPSSTRIINNQRLGVYDSIMAFGAADYLYVFGIDSSTNMIVGFVYDTTNHAAGFVGPTNIASVNTTASNQGFDVTTDGSFLFFSYHHINGGAAEIRLVKADLGTLAIAAGPVTVRAGTSGQAGNNSIHCNAGAIAITYALLIGGLVTVEQKRVTDPVLLGLGAAAVLANNEPLLTGVRTVSISATQSYGFWDRSYNAATEAPAGLNGSGGPPAVLWTDVGGTQAAPTSGVTHTAINLKLFAEPFLISGRMYLPVLGTRFVPPGSGAGAMGHYKGIYLTEVSAVATSNATATVMPVAANFLDIAALRQGRKVGIESNKAYVPISRRQHNPFDPEGQNRYAEYPIVQTVVYDFANRYRWQPANHKEDVMFSGALPYLFDGQTVHECGFAWRPEIGEAVVSGAGGLTVGDTYTYRLTYEWRDHRGNRMHSQPNFAVEGIVTPTVGNTTAILSASKLSLTMKGDFAAYFPGAVYLVLWRGSAAQTAAGEYVRVQEQRIFPYETGNLVFTDGATDASLDSAERLYIFGNELENTTAPPCEVLFQHRDRLFAFNTETNTIWYTKPMTPERGIEWSLSQQIPVPEKVVAGASLEDSAVFYTKNRVYMIRGDGPGATGTPVDAFSRLELINADIGCYERCAAWRTPAGVFFRAQNGIWLTTRSGSFQYVGAPVEDEVDGISYCVAGVVDQGNGCFRLYYARDSHPYGSESTYCLNYWYDTGRWSIDDFVGLPPVSAVSWDGAVVFADRDEAWQLSEGLYQDGANFYPQGVTMGWARLGDLNAYKRVWRVLVALKFYGGAGLQVTVARSFNDTAADTWTFEESTVGGDPGHIRVHQRIQKVTAIRVTLTEYQVDEDDPGVRGFELFGLGFELGMKQGAVKLPQARSA